MRNNGVHHFTTSPYHPSSNGLAEGAVQTFKSGMKKLTEGTLETRLTRFLFHYRTTPHATTGQCPAELMLGRQLRTRLDLLKPNIGKRVRAHQEQQKRAHQEQQKRAHDAHSKPREPGVQVYAKNFGQGPPWLPGVIQDLKGPVSYTIELQDGRVVQRHVDHVRARTATVQPSVEMNDYPIIKTPSQNPELPPTDPPPAAAGQSLCRSFCSHKSPERYGVTVRH